MRGKGILLDNDFDLIVQPERDYTGKIISGVQVGNTTYQNQALILILHPGEIKLSPVVGVGIEDMINDNDLLGWRRKIRQQMELDGQVVNKVSILQNGNIDLDAGYDNN